MAKERRSSASNKTSATPSSQAVWAQVGPEVPWNSWWPKAVETLAWPQNLLIERYSTEDFSWSRVFDSLKSLTLFQQKKALIILKAEKALKLLKEDEWHKFLEGPHHLVFVSEDPKPKSLEMREFQFQLPDESTADEKAAFRWIDFVHQNHLSEAVKELDLAMKAGSHPLQLLQLLHRDFRIGRLVQYALDNRFREDEITQSLKVHPYAIRKWSRRQRIKKTEWSQLFDRLMKADLEMKSGCDEIWALRKLTFDLISQLQLPKRKRVTSHLGQSGAQTPRLFPGLNPPASSNEPLWTIVPSFS